MTDIPVPKYAIGDVVYRPRVDHATESLPCPDCLDSKRWTATSPAGEQHEIACPRCSDQYAHSGVDKQDIRAILTGQPNRGLSADDIRALTSRRR